MSEDARYTFTHGSTAEGCVVYDRDTKFQVHHDSCPARGQTNAFDLVRLMKFGHLDKGLAADVPVTELPSYKAMVEFALALPEVQSEMVTDDFEDLGELTPEEQMPVERKLGAAALARRICDVLKTPTRPRWLIPDYIERGVIAILAGKRGSYKSFIALDWGMRVASAGLAVYVISAEGGDFDRRAKAWWMRYGDGRSVDDIPLYVVERRLDLNNKDGVELVRQDCLTLGIRPVLFIFDTFSKLSGGLDENENSAVKQFIGRLDNGLKRAETGFDATVLLVAHTGHSDDTRARGASALGADTDAEYIVKRDERNGTVQVSRERFKSSPELAPVSYRPDVVDLGYDDGAGRSVTSLVLAAVEGTDEQGGHVREPRGAALRAVWEILQDMTPDGLAVNVSELLDRARDGMAVPEGRDRRRELSRQRLDRLVTEGFAHYLNGGTQVTTTRAVLSVDEDFAEVPS
jgi:hypothetical protein